MTPALRQLAIDERKGKRKKRLCEDCGTNISNRQGLAKLCRDCAEERRRERVKQANAKYRKIHTGKKTPHIPIPLFKEGRTE